MTEPGGAYARSGVDTERRRERHRRAGRRAGADRPRPAAALDPRLRSLRKRARRWTASTAIALSTDGVGTKLLIAQELEKYDTVGIDCVAMNANDIICVGARPISMVDYVAVERADPAFLGSLARPARRRQPPAINIPGGEIAQVRELLHTTSVA